MVLTCWRPAARITSTRISTFEAVFASFGGLRCVCDRVGRLVTKSAPPQNRTCGFPAYGSSERVGLQPSVSRKIGVADAYSWRHQRVLYDESFQLFPRQASL